ncbi:MAG: Lpg1974 family pore-forming outer membrane protein [Pirellula sp.]|jgi:hypothetical protein|nr:Lpg1974 family pore-forming outer membrane protein [Pirellula sp.]
MQLPSAQFRHGTRSQNFVPPLPLDTAHPTPSHPFCHELGFHGAPYPHSPNSQAIHGQFLGAGQSLCIDASSCRPWRFAGGFEAVALRASFDQNVAMIIDPVPGNRSVPFDYGYDFSPRVSLGLIRDGLGGFRTNYWYFDTEAPRETATAVAGATPVYLFVYGSGGNLTRNAYADLGETLITTHDLRLQAFDIEYFDCVSTLGWQLQPGAGIRIAEIKQHMQGDVFSAGALQETVTNDLKVQGVGPTVALLASRCFGSSPFGFYSNLRGSLLLSQTQQQIYEMKNAGVDQVLDRDDHQEVITMLELGLGLRYTRRIGKDILATANFGYEVQSWQDVGGPVDSTSSLGLDGIATSLLFGY